MTNRFVQDAVAAFKDEIVRLTEQRDEADAKLFKCRAVLKAAQEALDAEIERREQAEAELERLKGGADV